MSLSESIVLANEADANRTFVTTIVDKTSVTRLDEATTLQTPTKLVISHNTSGSGDSLADRHLIQATRVTLDSNDVPMTTVVNLTISQPRRAASNADVLDLVSFIKELIDNAGNASDALVDILQGQS